MFDFRNTRKQQARDLRVRALVAGVFVLACFGLLLYRLYDLQVKRHAGLAARAENNRIAVQAIAPRRGEVFDRNGVVLAKNTRDYMLTVVPSQAGDLDSLLEELAPIVPVSAYEARRFRRRVAESSRYAPVLLRDRLSELEAAAFSAHAYRYPGVALAARWLREYPQFESAAHVLGYIGRIATEDQDALAAAGQTGNYRATEVIGKKGIEKTWEHVLHGTTGLEEVEVTASGRPVRSLRRIAPTPGSNLVLSLDMDLQRVAETAFGARRGALVALDPNNGEVLAFVSRPSFDPNLFIDGIDVESWQQLNDSPDHPLINRPLYGTYPIGSTYKPFVALAALELGKRRAAERINDPGYYEFAGQRFRNAGSVAYGAIDMHRALVVSSDTYFYTLAPEIGVDALHDFMAPFGFGQLTGIDLDGERRGILPSTDWKRRAFKTREQQRWYTGETISVAVGQGYNAFTLLQLAQATAVLANGGSYHTPHLVRAIIDPADSDGRQRRWQVPMLTRQIALKPENLAVIKRALVEVTRTGTARAAFAGAPYQVAGKTGTAQVYSLRGARYRSEDIDERLRDHALFMAYAPAEQPQIALALLVENSGWGSAAAAPIARTVFDHWLAREETTSEAASGQTHGRISP